MAENQQTINDWLPIDDFWEAKKVLEALEIELKILGKHIRYTIKESLKALPGKLTGQFGKIGKSIRDAFQIQSMEDYVQVSSICGKELADTLCLLSQQFAGLKLAVLQAAAPIVQVLLPVVQFAVRMLTGLAQSLGYVFRMLLFGTAETDSYTAGMDSATSANYAFKKSLAGFDEINRLGESSGSSVYDSGLWNSAQLQPLGGLWKELADRLAELMKPLREIDFGPAAQSLEKLRKALEPITKALFAGLEWAWENLFVPLAKWTAEELLPVFLDTLTAAMESMAQVIQELKPCFTWLWENFLMPWAQWKADQIISGLNGIRDSLTGVSDWGDTGMTFTENMVVAGETLMQTMAGVIEKLIGVDNSSILASGGIGEFLSKILVSNSPLQGAASAVSMFGGALGNLTDRFEGTKSAIGAVWDVITSLSQKGWPEMNSGFVSPMEGGLKKVCNGIIGAVNGTLSGAEKAVNFIVNALNAMSFTVPSWVPILGGRTYSFNLQPVTAPTIPALAKGAVLPANKPFLALVGDQKHGTNVEAPLSVIQEAVAAVMEDYAAGNMAGHQATVSVLQELLAAVLGISLGDDAIAGAVARYERKMAVVQGGF